MNGEVVKRGDIFLVELGPAIGSEQSGNRPVVIIQNDIGNQYSPTVIIAPITAKTFYRKYPTNVHVKAKEAGLGYDSTILLNQIKTIDKKRLGRKIGHLKLAIMREVDEAIKISLGLTNI